MRVRISRLPVQQSAKQSEKAIRGQLCVDNTHVPQGCTRLSDSISDRCFWLIYLLRFPVF